MLFFLPTLEDAKRLAAKLRCPRGHDWIYPYEWVRVCSRCDVVERRRYGKWS